MTIAQPSNEGPVATKGKTEGGIYIPPGVDEFKAEQPDDLTIESGDKMPGKLYVPPGLEAVADLPDDGLTPPEEKQYEPRNFAKNSCKYCFGHGLVMSYNQELRADEKRLCSCVETRIAKGLGPRRK